jgi:hypothetical protein
MKLQFYRRAPVFRLKPEATGKAERVVRRGGVAGKTKQVFRDLRANQRIVVRQGEDRYRIRDR